MKLFCKKMAYGDLVVFRDFAFEQKEGGVTCILGASGCGKTTLLNMIGGLVAFEGARDFPDRVSYCFQTPRLIPALTVEQNLAFVLSGMAKEEKRRRIAEALENAEIADSAKKYPSELSGGMAQRAAMARAFCYPAPLLLMDEPFQSLDVRLKEKLIREFIAHRERDGRTVVLVTHSPDEALMLGDRVAVLGGNAEGFVLDEPIDLPRDRRSYGNMPALEGLRERIYAALLHEKVTEAVNTADDPAAEEKK